MKHRATVTRTTRESADTTTVFFTVDGKVLPFVAGQYVTISFEETGDHPGKAYSLSSTPFDAEMSITVKNIGLFSGLACERKPGDSFFVSDPYGYFNVRSEAPIVALVAGVGIAPVWSIVRDELHENTSRAISLLCSAPTQEELIFLNAARALAKTHPSLTAQFFTTQEKGDDTKNRRLSIQDDVSSEQLRMAQFYVCGSFSFVKEIWNDLMRLGVDEQRVVTETFFETQL